MPTLICSPPVASVKQLHDILTHFGFKEGDLISATHVTRSGCYDGPILRCAGGTLILRPGDYSYTSFTYPSLPANTIDPSNPSTWPPALRTTITNREEIQKILREGLLPLDTPVAYSYDASSLKTKEGRIATPHPHSRAGRGSYKTMVTSDLQVLSSSGFTETLTSLTLPPGMPHPLQHPTQFNEQTASCSPTPEATQDPSPMAITHQIVTVSGLKPSPTPQDPNAETEVFLDGPLTVALTTDQNPLNTQEWIFANVAKITAAGVRPASVTVTRSTLPRT